MLLQTSSSARDTTQKRCLEGRSWRSLPEIFLCGCSPREEGRAASTAASVSRVFTPSLRPQLQSQPDQGGWGGLYLTNSGSLRLGAFADRSTFAPSSLPLLPWLQTTSALVPVCLILGNLRQTADSSSKALQKKERWVGGRRRTISCSETRSFST